MSQKKPEGPQGIAKVIKVFIQFFFGVLWRGIRNSTTWSRQIIGRWLLYISWLSLVVYGPRWSLSASLDSIATLFNSRLLEWLSRHTHLQMISLSLVPVFIWLFLKGFRNWSAIKRYQNALAHLGLKTSTGFIPKVADVIDVTDNQRRILVQSVGIDIASFREKKGAMESAFNTIVKDIEYSYSSKQLIEILAVDKELPTNIRFEDCLEQLKRPYTFLVGQALDGLIVADLCEIHHMLIAGATGGGKSVFFKQALVGLLHSSRMLQLYLIDLKRGVEFKKFGELSNVSIAKDEASAVMMLRRIVKEMDRRFAILEKNGSNEISPERDNLDRIVVAVDEASVLFTVEKSSKENKAIAQEARELTDKIAKLGRAAGIHLILATQKVVKETIDTRVQTNINAKMCFRVNTTASSNTVLGNKMAAELPDIKGRGIWSVGSQFTHVQVPNLNAEEIKEEIGNLTNVFNGASSPLKQKMLETKGPLRDQPEELTVKISPAETTAAPEA